LPNANGSETALSDASSAQSTVGRCILSAGAALHPSRRRLVHWAPAPPGRVLAFAAFAHVDEVRHGEYDTRNPRIAVPGIAGCSGIDFGLERMYSLGSVISSPVVVDGVVYVGSTDGSIYALL
jgi:hypothetical protein